MEELRARYHNRLAEIRQLQQRAAQVTSTARSRDGLVSVVVGAQGQLVGLQLDPAAYERMSPQRLAALLVEVAKTAAAHAAGQVSDIMAPVRSAGGMSADGGLVRLMEQTTRIPDDETAPTRPQ